MTEFLKIVIGLNLLCLLLNAICLIDYLLAKRKLNRKLRQIEHTKQPPYDILVWDETSNPLDEKHSEFRNKLHELYINEFSTQDADNNAERDC